MRLLSKTPEAATRRYDMVAIIPAYDEGCGALGMLESVAVQQGIDDARVAMLVVINQPPDASASVALGNERTHELVEALWDDHPPSSLEHCAQPYPLDTRRRLQAFSAAARSRVEYLLLDCWSHGHALPGCNVGLARDLGAEAACGLVESLDDGILFMSDADSAYVPGYFAAARELFAAGAVAATGPLDIYPDGTPESERAHRLLRIFQAFGQAQHAILDRDAPRRPRQRRWDHMFSGANMTMRPRVFLAHRFDPLRGAEDVGMAAKILASGASILSDPRLVVRTPCRESGRTDEDHGFGHVVARHAKYAGRFGESPAGTLRQVDLFRRLLDALEDTRDRAPDDAAAWRAAAAALPVHGAPKVTSEEADALWAAHRLVPNISHVEVNAFVVNAARAIVCVRHPSVPLREALDDLEHRLRAADEEGEPGMTAYLQCTRANDDLVRLLNESALNTAEYAAPHVADAATARRMAGLSSSAERQEEEQARHRVIDLLGATALNPQDDEIRRLERVLATVAGATPSAASAAEAMRDIARSLYTMQALSFAGTRLAVKVHHLVRARVAGSVLRSAVIRRAEAITRQMRAVFERVEPWRATFREAVADPLLRAAGSDERVSLSRLLPRYEGILADGVNLPDAFLRDFTRRVTEQPTGEGGGAISGGSGAGAPAD